MYQVKELYAIWEDGDGHKHLIKADEYFAFEEALELISELTGTDYYTELEEVIETFSCGELEGGLHYVVLDKDVIV